MTTMDIDAIREALSLLEKAAPGTTAKAPRGPLLKALAVLDAYAGKTVEEAVAALEALKPPKPIKKPPTPKKATSSSDGTPRPKKPVLPLQTQIVDASVEKLRIAEASLADFNATIAALEKDKSVRVQELKAIVGAYAGDTSAFRARGVGLGVIRQEFERRWKLREHNHRMGATANG